MVVGRLTVRASRGWARVRAWSRRTAVHSTALAREDSGSIIVFVAITMVIMLTLFGFVIDLGYGAVEHSVAQNAADATALAAIQEISGGLTESAATTTANLVVSKNNFPSSELTLGYLNASGSATTSAGNVVTVTSTISNTYSTLFLRVVGFNSVTVAATAAAINNGATVPCVLCVLSASANPALLIENNGVVSVTNGAAVINSSAAGGLTVDNNASIQAQAIDIVGVDSVGNNGSVSPAPSHITAIADPFAAMTPPTLPGTSGASYEVPNNGTGSVNAGVFTTITVDNNGSLTMNPGTYYITNSLTVSNNATITANHVLLYFTCGGPFPAACLNTGQAGGALDLSNNTTLTISGPTSGTWQGLTILYDRHNTSSLYLSNNAGTVSGTIYAKSAQLYLKNNSTALTTRAIVGTLDVQNNASATFTFSSASNYAPPGSPGLVR